MYSSGVGTGTDQWNYASWCGDSRGFANALIDCRKHSCRHPERSRLVSGIVHCSIFDTKPPLKTTIAHCFFKQHSSMFTWNVLLRNIWCLGSAWHTRSSRVTYEEFAVFSLGLSLSIVNNSSTDVIPWLHLWFQLESQQKLPQDSNLPQR